MTITLSSLAIPRTSLTRMLVRGGRTALLLAVPITLTLAACSSDDAPAAAPFPEGDGGGGADVDAAPTVTPSVACTTLHRKLQRPNPDYYRVFASDQDAFTYAKDLMPKLGKKAALPPGDALQTQGQALSDRAYAGLKRLYPDDVAGMPGPPRVLVIDDDAINAFAAFDPFDATARAPWVFFVNRGPLQKYASDPDAFVAVIAHELGHLVVKNGRPEVKAAMSIYYKVPSASEDGVFGEYQKTDPVAQATISKIIQIGSYCGQVTESELNGYPVSLGQGVGGPSDSTPQFVDWLRRLETVAVATNPSCQKAFAGEAAIKSLVFSKASVDKDIFLGADAPKLDAMTKAFATDIATCLATTTVPLLNVAAADYKLKNPKSASTVDSLLVSNPDGLAAQIGAKPARDIDLRFPTGVTVSKLLLISKEAQTALRALVEDPKTEYPDLRHYYYEDEADVVSARVCKLLGVPMQKQADLLIDAFLPTAAQPECRAKIAAGKRVGYGGFVEVHHGSCWRAYRGLQLEKALGTCGPGWPEDAAATPVPFGDGGT